MLFFWASQHSVFLQEQGHYRGKSSEQWWFSGIASASLFAEEKWFHGGSYPQNCWLQQSSVPSADCLLLCQHRCSITTTLFSAERKECCPSFFPSSTPPSVNDTVVMAHSWLHRIRREGRGKEERKEERERQHPPPSAAQKQCPVVSAWEFLTTQGETLGEGTGTGRWVDGNRHWACIQRMEEAVRDFCSLRPYSMLSPAVSQASRCHSNHGGRGGSVFRSLRYKDVFK